MFDSTLIGEAGPLVAVLVQDSMGYIQMAPLDRVEFPNPVFIGDTIRVTTKVVDRRESRSRPEWGIVTFEHVGTNQRDQVVCRAARKAMMLKKMQAT